MNSRWQEGTVSYIGTIMRLEFGFVRDSRAVVKRVDVDSLASRCCRGFAEDNRDFLPDHLIGQTYGGLDLPKAIDFAGFSLFPRERQR
jgi:hypothetical protein